VAAYDRTGRLIRTVGRFNGTEQVVLVQTQSGRMTVSKRLLPYGRATWRLVSRTQIVVGETDRYAVVRYDANGNQVGAFQEARALVPLTGEEQAAMRRRITGSADRDQQRAAEQALRSVDLPTTHPAWSGLAVMPDGRLFVREIPQPDAGHVTWRVFEPTGRAVGSVDLPVAARIMDVRGSTLITVEEDDFGVEQVVLYRTHAP
jgi:hypothetical protein